jgi:hypothetical protein
MAFIRATYHSGSIIEISNNSQLAIDQEKYWISESGVSETQGVWDNENNRFIPDGLLDDTTGWLWPENLDWSNYNAND